MTDDGHLPPSPPKLPVWDVAWGSYRFVFVNFDRFVALAWFPLAISFIGFIPDFLPYPAMDWVLWVVLTTAAFAVFAVRWHRFVLLDDHSGILSELSSPRNLRFLIYTLGFMWMPWIPFFAIEWLYSDLSLADEGMHGLFIGMVGYFSFAMFLVFFRLTMLLPATAIDKPIGVRDVWRRMGGNTWHLIGAFVLIIIPLVITANLLSGFMGLYLTLPISGAMYSFWVGEYDETLPFALQAGFHLIGESISLVGLAVGITLLSATHWHVVGPKQQMLTRRRRPGR